MIIVVKKIAQKEGINNNTNKYVQIASKGYWLFFKLVVRIMIYAIIRITLECNRTR